MEILLNTRIECFEGTLRCRTAAPVEAPEKQ